MLAKLLPDGFAPNRELRRSSENTLRCCFIIVHAPAAKGG